MRALVILALILVAQDLSEGGSRVDIQELREQIQIAKSPYEKSSLLHRLGAALEVEGRTEEAVDAWMEIADLGVPYLQRRLARHFIARWEDGLADRVLREAAQAPLQYPQSGIDLKEEAARMAFFQGRVQEAIDLLFEIHATDSIHLGGYVKPSPKREDLFRLSIDPDKTLTSW
jgi:hypothetical protein